MAYGYDADGQRTSMTDGTGASSYAYDSLHRLTTHSDGAGHTVTYGYDLNNQPTAIGYPSPLGGGGGTVTRGYDDAGRLSSVGDWLGNTTQFGHDPNSQLTTQTYPNGASATQTYDNADRLTNISDASPTAGQFLNLAYGHNPAGLLSSEGSSTFGYDQNNRLQTQSAAPAVNYGYDTADNPTSTTVSGGPSKTMSYDAAHQLSTMTTTGSPPTTNTYAYDPNGNRTSDGITPGAYAYDQANRLTGYLTSTTYAYDGDGLRTNKTGLTGAEPYTWDTAAALPELIGDASTAYITGPAGLPLEQITSDRAVHYYHHDQLGSTRAITDQTGNVAATSTYDPYGNPVAQTGTLTNPFGYAGQYTDPETGLQYLRARYYDPNTQSFLTRDPLTPTTRTPYTYTNNNPTNNTDPTGQDCAAGGQGDGSGAGTVEPTAAELAWPGFYMPGLVYIPTLDDLFSAIKAGVRDPLHNPLDALALIPPLKALRGIGILGRAFGIGEKAAKGAEDAGALDGSFSTFTRDAAGRVNRYTTHRPAHPQDPAAFRPSTRFDGSGRPHFNKATGEYVPTPHVHDPGVPGGVRPPTPDEVPR